MSGLIDFIKLYENINIISQSSTADKKSTQTIYLDINSIPYCIECKNKLSENNIYHLCESCLKK